MKVGDAVILNPLYGSGSKNWYIIIQTDPVVIRSMITGNMTTYDNTDYFPFMFVPAPEGIWWEEAL